MEICMKVTRDIIVKMIEHGSFDNLPAVTSEMSSLQRNELMAMQICKVYKTIFETILILQNNSMDVIEQHYLVENQT